MWIPIDFAPLDLDPRSMILNMYKDRASGTAQPPSQPNIFIWFGSLYDVVGTDICHISQAKFQAPACSLPYTFLRSYYTLVTVIFNYLFTIFCTAIVQYVPYDPQEHKNRKDRICSREYMSTPLATTPPLPCQYTFELIIPSSHSIILYCYQCLDWFFISSTSKQIIRIV